MKTEHKLKQLYGTQSEAPCNKVSYTDRHIRNKHENLINPGPVQQHYTVPDEQNVLWSNFRQWGQNDRIKKSFFPFNYWVHMFFKSLYPDLDKSEILVFSLDGASYIISAYFRTLHKQFMLPWCCNNFHKPGIIKSSHYILLISKRGFHIVIPESKTKCS